MKRILALIALFTFALMPAATRAQGIEVVAIDTLGASELIQGQVAFPDLDSLQITLQIPDTANGRVRISAYNTVTGSGTKITADTISLGNVTTLVPIHKRFSWFDIKTAAGGTWTAWPSTVVVEFISYATGNALKGRTSTPKRMEIDVRKYRRK